MSEAAAEAIRLWEQLPSEMGGARLATLLELASLSRGEDQAPFSLALAEQALEEAKCLRDEEGVARALFVRANALYDVDRCEEAASDARRAGDFFSRQETHARACQAYLLSSYAFEAIDQLPEALVILEMAFLTAMHVEDEVWLGNCYQQRADLYEAMGRPPSAVLKELDSALAIFICTDGHERLDIQQKRASLYILDAQPSKAVEILRTCIPHAHELDEGYGYYMEYLLAQALRHGGNYREALEVLERPLKHNEEVFDTSVIARIKLEMSTSRWELGEHDTAFELLASAREGFEVAGSIGDIDLCDRREAMWLDHLAGHPKRRRHG